jgi:surfactin synthase thioesterase subunit
MNPTGAPLVQLQPRVKTDCAIVCIPHAGAGVSAFAPLAKSMMGRASVWAVRLPGRESRILEPPLRTIGEMAESLVEPVASIDTENIIILGQCSGAWVGFELIRVLARQSRRLPISWFVPCAQSPPRCLDAEIVPAPFATDAEIIDQLRAMGGTPASVLDDPELLELLVPAVRADSEAGEEYAIPANWMPIDVSIACFGGRHDTNVAKAEILEWEKYTTSRFEYQMFDGDHFFVQREGAGVAESLLRMASLAGKMVNR